mgnify:CR=1 FL=1
MKFEKDNNRIKKALLNKKMYGETGQGFGQQPVQQEVYVQPAKREMTKSKLNRTMYRELISWLGLFTSQKETLTFISKRVSQN